MHRTEDNTAPVYPRSSVNLDPRIFLVPPNPDLTFWPLTRQIPFPYCDTSHIQSLHHGREFPSWRIPCPWQWWPRLPRNDNPLHIYGEAGKENQADTRYTDGWQTRELQRSIISISTRVKQYFNSSLKSSSSNTYLFVSDEEAEGDREGEVHPLSDAFRFC